MALPSTGPAHAVIPWTKRPMISASMDVANTQAKLAATYRLTPASSTGRRPNRSESGPYTNWHTANP